MYKIILFYIFRPIKDPEAIRLWQQTLAQSLNLKGRIIIAEHGINGILGGQEVALKKYVKNNKTYDQFRDISYKWSDGTDQDFPRLSVKVRDEIVTFGLKDMLKVNDHGLVGGGRHLSPQQVHDLVKNKNSKVVFFDGRNQYEAETGRFKNAVIPEVNYTREFKVELKKPKYNHLKDKTVITYCTGGIRCEVLTVLMKKYGFKDVYQIDGGIEKYGSVYGDNGYWQGSMYTFDGRMGLKFSSKTKDIAKCCHCRKKTSNYANCSNKKCNKLLIICPDCQDKNLFCSLACQTKSSLPTNV